MKTAKTTSKQWIKKLDKLASDITRSEGQCTICGKTDSLQCAHVISRRYYHTRWDLENLLCLCWNCHFNFAHKDPVGFGRWFDLKFGGGLYDTLKKRSLKIGKIDYEKLYKELKYIYERTE